MSARRKKKSRTIAPQILTASTAIIILFLLVTGFVFRFKAKPHQFPVTVNPQQKMIKEDPLVNELLAAEHSLFRAASAESKVSISGTKGYTVIIKPGLRKEQVAAAFGKALNWTAQQRCEFTTPLPGSYLPFAEGTFAPGTYHVTSAMTPLQVQAMVNERFTNDVLAHYGTSTQDIVPLKEALIIASLIQRETIGTDGMRLVSGVIWNRLFINMSLQIDATLQYAKANSGETASWWPRVASVDKYLSSPYNTYMHAGLPPEPISNPSVAAILAALNPIETPCLFYLNDSTGAFHCSATYEDHVALIRTHY
jgi:cell division protein YceG involved in septum cleavage